MIDPTDPGSADCGAAAAYVLGALPGEERRAFEDHLAGCSRCHDTVTDLAGIPGLLSRVSPDDLTGAAAPVPVTVLPRLLTEVRRRNRGRRLTVLGLAAAAVLAVAVAIGALGALGGTGDHGPAGAAMTRLVSAPVRALVALQADGANTRIDMTCWYDVASYADLPSYDLVVTGVDGHRHDVARWQVGPDGSTRVVASVDVPEDRIRTIEVRTVSGRPVLRLDR